MVPDDIEVPEGVAIRFTEEADGKFLKEWLIHPSADKGFAVKGEKEVDDAVSRWIIFHKYKCSLTATLHGVPCGIATLYLQPYRRLAHQCEFGIVVGHEFRDQKVGSILLSSLIKLAKEQFKIEVLSLCVNAENPAIKIYRRFGFREYGRQTHFLKEAENVYVARIYMERFL